MPKLRLPPRAWAWALLALTILPTGVLSKNGSAWMIYPPLALLALLLPPPAGRPRWVFDRRLLWPILAFFAWALVTLLWTTDIEWGLRRWPHVLALVLLTLAGSGAAKAAAPDERRLVFRAAAIGFAIAVLLHVSEYFTDAAVRRLFNPEDDVSNAFDKTSVALMMMAMVAIALGQRLRPLLQILPAAAVLALSVLFGHWAGVLGLVAALLVWAFALWQPKAARHAWTAFLLLALFAWPFIGLVLQATTSADDAWKPRELVTREQMWRFGAERILEKPVFGWGFQGSKSLPSMGEEPLRGDAERVISNHPHNVPLLLWLELGIPGVLLAGWFLFAVKAEARQPLAQALLMFICAHAMLSGGLWPPAWLTPYCAAALLFCLLAGPRESETREERGQTA